jgi:hypothetical protein
MRAVYRYFLNEQRITVSEIDENARKEIVAHDLTLQYSAEKTLERCFGGWIGICL